MSWLTYWKAVSFLGVLLSLSQSGHALSENVTHTHADLSPTVVPTPTSTLSPSTPTLSPSPSTPTPSPTHYPKPTGPISFHRKDCLVVEVEEFDISYMNGSTSTMSLSMDTLASQYTQMLQNVTGYCQNKKYSYITYIRQYGDNGHWHFWLSMTFFMTSDGTQWYMDSFKHQNGTLPIYTYTGVQQSIRASYDASYKCDDRMTFKGSTFDFSELTSKVQIKGVWMQAFSVNGITPTPRYSVCGYYSNNNFVINVAIGVTVGGLLLITLVSIVIVIVVKRVRNRGYDLLDS